MSKTSLQRAYVLVTYQEASAFPQTSTPCICTGLAGLNSPPKPLLGGGFWGCDQG